MKYTISTEQEIRDKIEELERKIQSQTLIVNNASEIGSSQISFSNSQVAEDPDDVTTFSISSDGISFTSSKSAADKVRSANDDEDEDEESGSFASIKSWENQFTSTNGGDVASIYQGKQGTFFDAPYISIRSSGTRRRNETSMNKDGEIFIVGKDNTGCSFVGNPVLDNDFSPSNMDKQRYLSTYHDIVDKLIGFRSCDTWIENKGEIQMNGTQAGISIYGGPLYAMPKSTYPLYNKNIKIKYSDMISNEDDISRDKANTFILQRVNSNKATIKRNIESSSRSITNYIDAVAGVIMSSAMSNGCAVVNKGNVVVNYAKSELYNTVADGGKSILAKFDQLYCGDDTTKLSELIIPKKAKIKVTDTSTSDDTVTVKFKLVLTYDEENFKPSEIETEESSFSFSVGSAGGCPLDSSSREAMGCDRYSSRLIQLQDRIESLERYISERGE